VIYTASFDHDVADLKGNMRHLEYTWAFKAGAFSVVSTYPEDDLGCVPTDVELTIECSEPLDASTVTSDKITITDEDGNTVGGDAAVTDSFITVTPFTPLKPLTEYTVEIGEDIGAASGSGLIVYNWNFSTKGENLLPLAIGNKWVYSVLRYYPGQGVSSYLDSIVIVRDSLAGDNLFYIDQSGRRFHYDADTIQTSILIEPYFYGWHSETVTLVNDFCNQVMREIDTDLGIFNCQHFGVTLNRLPPYSVSYDFAPGVGIVSCEKSRYVDSWGNDEQHWKLVRYELK
jgi:hypothetical protein